MWRIDGREGVGKTPRGCRLYPLGALEEREWRLPEHVLNQVNEKPKIKEAFNGETKTEGRPSGK